VRISFHEDRSDDLQKNCLRVILGAIFFKSKHVGHHFFSNQNMVGAFFASVFREFAQIFTDFKNIFTDFAQISTDFAWIFNDFAQIFTKSKFLGVRLHPHLLHHWTRS